MTTVPPQLFQRWVHIREEDRGRVRSYRPIDGPVPLGRGREGLEFHPDGTLTRYGTGADDAPTGTSGRWRADDGGQIRASGVTVHGATELRVVEVTQELLRIEA